MNDLPTRRGFNRHGARTLEQQIDTALTELAADRKAREVEHRKAREVDEAPEGTITARQLEPGMLVRDKTGWHGVIRVNQTTVTVPGPWGGTRTIRVDRIREVQP